MPKSKVTPFATPIQNMGLTVVMSDLSITPSLSNSQYADSCSVYGVKADNTMPVSMYALPSALSQSQNASIGYGVEVTMLSTYPLKLYVLRWS